MLYYDTNRKFPAFRRPVEPSLQPFILTKEGKPRTEWRNSFGTFDKQVILEAYADHLKRTNAEIRLAEEARDRWLEQSRKTPEERERERARWEAEREADDLRSAEAAREDAEYEAREAGRQGLIALALKEDQPELLALRDVIDPYFLEPPEVRQAREDRRVGL